MISYFCVTRILGYSFYTGPGLRMPTLTCGISDYSLMLGVHCKIKMLYLRIVASAMSGWTWTRSWWRRSRTSKTRRWIRVFWVLRRQLWSYWVLIDKLQHWMIPEGTANISYTHGLVAKVIFSSHFKTSHVFNTSAPKHCT